MSFHNGSHYDFPFIMKLIESMGKAEGSVEIIPTTEDKEMQIEYHDIQFKDSLKFISSTLKSIVAQTLRDNLEHYKYTKTQLRRYCEKRGKQWSDESSICWHGRNPYSILSSNHTHLWTIPSYHLANSVMMIWRVKWCLRMKMITWWNCGKPSISRHEVNTISYTTHSMWFSWPMHLNTSETPHWMHSV